MALFSPPVKKHPNGFQEINKHITCISTKDVSDIKLKRTPKIVEYLEFLFNSVYVPGEKVAIDEGMMAYKGKIKNRVYSPMKPDKWGMKFYILAESTTGFVSNLRIVGEKCTLDKTVEELTEKLTGCNRTLYMDNYYNSFKLSEQLLSRGIYVCGTLRSKRGGPSNLIQIKNKIPKAESLFFKKKIRSYLFGTIRNL